MHLPNVVWRLPIFRDTGQWVFFLHVCLPVYSFVYLLTCMMFPRLVADPIPCRSKLSAGSIFLPAESECIQGSCLLSRNGRADRGGPSDIQNIAAGAAMAMGRCKARLTSGGVQLITQLCNRTILPNRLSLPRKPIKSTRHLRLIGRLKVRAPIPVGLRPHFWEGGTSLRQQTIRLF